MKVVAYVGLFTLAVVGCSETPETPASPKPVPQLAAPRADWTTETPSSVDYYPFQYPDDVDDEVSLDVSDSYNAAGYTCPQRINGALIPGNIWPYHNTHVGRYKHLLTRIAYTGVGASGVPKAEYRINDGPWVSDDGKIIIISGVIEGWGARQ